MFKVKELLDLVTADLVWSGSAVEVEKIEKRAQIGPIGGDGIDRQPSLHGQVLQKEGKLLGEVVDAQGSAQWLGKTKTPRREPSGRLFRSGFSSG